MQPELDWNAHPLKPFPGYVPRTFKDKLHWAFIQLRWFVIKPFVEK